VVLVGVAMAAKEHHRSQHSGRKISFMMAEQARVAEMQLEGLSVGTLLRHQDDLCHGTEEQMRHGFFDHILAQQCTNLGGVCVQNEDDCSNSEFGSQGEGGVIKGTCGSGCGCCFAGCPPQWVGDGECDFACNKEEHGWDGSDCRGASPLFSECPAAWFVIVLLACLLSTVDSRRCQQRQLKARPSYAGLATVNVMTCATMRATNSTTETAGKLQ
jgi:hypothetical protein